MSIQLSSILEIIALGILFVNQSKLDEKTIWISWVLTLVILASLFRRHIDEHESEEELSEGPERVYDSWLKSGALLDAIHNSPPPRAGPTESERTSTAMEERRNIGRSKTSGVPMRSESSRNDEPDVPYDKSVVPPGALPNYTVPVRSMSSRGGPVASYDGSFVPPGTLVNYTNDSRSNSTR